LNEDKNIGKLKEAGIIKTGSKYSKYTFPKRKEWSFHRTFDEILDNPKYFKEYLEYIEPYMDLPFQKNIFYLMDYFSNYEFNGSDKTEAKVQYDLFREGKQKIHNEDNFTPLTLDLINKDFESYMNYFSSFYGKFFMKKIKIKRLLFQNRVFAHNDINLKRIYENYLFLTNVLLYGDMYCRNSEKDNRLYSYEYASLGLVNHYANKHKIYILDASFNKDTLKYVTKKLFEKPKLTNYLEIDSKNNFLKYNYLKIELRNKNCFVLYNDFYKNGKSTYGIGRQVGINEREGGCDFWNSDVKDFISEVIEKSFMSGKKIGLVTHKAKDCLFYNLFKRYLQEGNIISYPAKGSNKLENCDIVFILGNKHYGDNEYLERSYFNYDNLDPLIEEGLIKEKDIVNNFETDILKYEIDELTYQAIGRIRPYELEEKKSKIVVLLGWFPEKLRDRVSVIRQRLPNKTLRVLINKLLKDGANDENYISFNYVTEKESFDLLEDIFKETIKNMKAMTRKPRRLKDYFEADKKTLKLEKTALFNSMWDYKIKNKNYNN
ncbi:MAG: hypothetical protein KC589_01140, partial [Nanoarchaeota archaeon]|nr:hypothetical protein [Nanoarchaeota archaeon]